MEEGEGGDYVDLVVPGHLGWRCVGYGPKVVTNAGIGDDEVKGGHVVCLERRDCGGRGGVIFVVDFDDDEGCGNGFGDVLEVLAGGRIADAGYDCVVWT